ncbi:MAG: hypothetical protein HY327_03000 [Chloroflexi bacterium]|nr:hypothetical protein [Chloroflexota bacterium]
MNENISDPEPNNIEAASPSAPPPPPAKTAKHALFLPKGALIAFRKSGPAGAIEFFLYPDGRISFNVPDVSKKAYAHPARKLNDAQINRLRHLLDQVNFYRAPATQGNASADGVAYEISARGGSKSNAIELFDGSIPDALKPLVEQLNALMPQG